MSMNWSKLNICLIKFFLLQTLSKGSLLWKHEIPSLNNSKNLGNFGLGELYWYIENVDIKCNSKCQLSLPQLQYFSTTQFSYCNCHPEDLQRFSFLSLAQKCTKKHLPKQGYFIMLMKNIYIWCLNPGRCQKIWSEMRYSWKISGKTMRIKCLQKI